MHSLSGKVKSLQATFYVTNMNNSPNLLSRDTCYTLGVIKPCYSVEADNSSSSFQGIPQATPTSLQSTWAIQLCKVNMILIVKMKELSWKPGTIQGAPLTKARILDVYS